MESVWKAGDDGNRFLLQQVRCQIDIICSDKMRVEFLSYITAVYEAEQLMWWSVFQLLSFIRVYVIHHQIDFVLSEVFERRAFRQNLPDELVIYFAGPFLIRPLRVAIKYPCTIFPVLIQFDRRRISEFASPVGQYDREEITEHTSSQKVIQMVEHICHRPGGISFPQE